MKRQDSGITGSPNRLIKFWLTNAYRRLVVFNDQDRSNIHLCNSLLLGRLGIADRRLV